MPATKLVLRPATRASKSNHTLRIVDGRSAEAVLLRKVRDNLLSGCLPPISPLMMSLAERAAFVQVHLLRLDQIALTRKGGLPAAASRLYSSLSTQHSRLVKELARLTPPAPRGQSLVEHLARTYGEAAA
jgi:hypothetical protein